MLRHPILPLPVLAACAAALALALGGCATGPAPVSPPVSASGPVDPIRAARWLDRVTWGADAAALREFESLGPDAWLARQLHPPGRHEEALPAAAVEQIAAMRIAQVSPEDLARDMEARRKAADAIADPEEKKAAQNAWQQELNRLGREAAGRFLLRALYSPDQLREQMTWFWMNHFSVNQYKGMIRAFVGDYEERAVRPHALGKFVDLLRATARHPAMLRYLDNDQNAAGHVNENFARELLELHTLGVDGGYSQKDVQELARVLTGAGISLATERPAVRKDLAAQYLREGLFEFNPNRHDAGAKVLLGQPVRGQGMSEIDEALVRLARHPATARNISRKLAVYFVTDDPSPALIGRLAAVFRDSDGDIASVLAALFRSPEFAASLGAKFKDPVHYVVSAVRLAYDGRTILNPGPMIGWIARLGEPLYAHETPDGFALTRAAWSSPGQMTVRFEIAKAIGSGSAGLFRPEGPGATDRPAFPQLATPVYYRALQPGLAPDTRAALDQAVTPQEWNLLLLASPEFMRR